jgi:hypothetical protein
VSLAAPIGSEEPLPSAEPNAVPQAGAPKGWVGALTGVSKARPSLAEYARHVVTGMLAGAPYILSPGGDGVLSSAGMPSRGMLGGIFGYGNLTPAIMVMQAVAMPLLAMVDSGVPILWREVFTRCWHARPAAAATEDPTSYKQLNDNPMAA